MDSCRQSQNRREDNTFRLSEALRRSSYWIVVENFSDICQAFGADRAKKALDELCDRIVGIPGCSVGKIDLESMTARVELELSGAVGAVSCEEVLAIIGRRPYMHGGDRYILALSAQPVFSELREGVSTYQFRLKPANWLMAMQIAADVYEAVREDRLYFLYQPIADAALARSRLYSESLVRIRPAGYDGDAIPPSIFLPALERLKLTRLFDSIVLGMSIHHLLSDPTARIGCNISALSAIDDVWWQNIQQLLLAKPSVAARITLEITETASAVSVHQARFFAQKMKNLGCQIALDDFGAGYNSLQFAASIKPDLIKIDASFTSRMSEKDHGEEFLPSLISLSRCLSREVVVEGIACKEDFDRSSRAGARWFQGYYIAPPSRVIL